MPHRPCTATGPSSPLRKPRPGHPARVFAAWKVMPHRCVAPYQRAVTRSHAEKFAKRA
jgi:hypothetical protein